MTIVAPGLVLTQFSGLAALLAALALPLGWGLWDLWRQRRVNAMSAIGIVSTLLTGGVGLLELDARWFAAKEAAVPAAMGLAVAASAWTRHPLIHALVFDAALLDTERIHAALAARGAESAFERVLRLGTLGLAAIFFATAAASYGLARWIVTSPAGSAAFNGELGRLTLLSYPLVALPAMGLMIALMAWLARRARSLTGLEIGDMFRAPH